MHETAAAEPLIAPSFAMRVFYAFATLALISLAISIAGKWIGQSIVLGGHTDDRTRREIIVGNNVLSVPANAIRFEEARRDGVAHRLDLYLQYPQMEGYRPEARDAFNHAGEEDEILFLSFEQQMMSRDMSGRFSPIYSALIEEKPHAHEGDVALHAFRPTAGYMNEILAVAPREAGAPYVARCLDGELAQTSLAPCERDLLIGDGLALTYRFPRRLLADWHALDAAVLETARFYLRTGG